MNSRISGSLFLGGAALLVLLIAVPATPDSSMPGAEELRPVASFNTIADPAERSVALFTEAGKVLLHPRCTNCHPSGDSPLQGDDAHLHEPPVDRGTGGLGVVGMRCATCHQDANFDPGAVPGAPHWVLAPARMAWHGRTLAEICNQLKDPVRNGQRTMDQIVEHVNHDALVAWGWDPGPGRQPAPGSQRAFGQLIQAWIDTGAVCPQ